MSNRDYQPFQFSCPSCGDLIIIECSGCFRDDDFQFTVINGVDELESLNDAMPILKVDLHLDLPIIKDKTLQSTIFFNCIDELGLTKYQLLAQKLDMLNDLHKSHNELKRLIRHFLRKNIDAFERTLESIPLVSLASIKQEDVYAAIYASTTLLSSPLCILEKNQLDSDRALDFLQLQHIDNKLPFEKYVSYLFDSNILVRMHEDVIGLYPRMLSFDVFLRPALYFDFINLSEEYLASGYVSNSKIDQLLTLYQDMYEVFARLLVFLMGYKNVVDNADHDSFSNEFILNKKQKPIKKYTSLKESFELNLDEKKKVLRGFFCEPSFDSIDARLRNGIAHYNYRIKEAEQLIVFQPKKTEFASQGEFQIGFLQFTRSLLELFREIHSINHVIKGFIFFRLLTKKN